MGSKIKAVLFDLGDTILNFGKFDTMKAIRSAAELSWNYLKELDQPVGSFNSYLFRNLLALKFHFIKSEITGNDFDSLELLRSSGLKRGVKLSDEHWRHVNWLWYKPLYEIAQVEEDIIATLESLNNDMKLDLGIVSNTFVNGYVLDEHLSRLDLLYYFPVRLYSCDYSYRKPDKRIMLEAAKKIGHEPSEILFVGDKLKTDMKGAIRTGMVPVIKESHANIGKKTPSEVTRIKTLSELPGLISDLNARQD